MAVAQRPGFAGRFERVRLATEVLGTYVRVRWLVWRRGEVPAVSVLRGGLRERVGCETDGVRVARARQFGRAVVKVLGLLPADSRCLMRSLVLTRMLARRGFYAKVVIGVRREPTFGAHAWVELDGHPVLAAGEDVYRRIVEI